jgi:membrane protein
LSRPVPASATAAARKGREWVERQDAATRPGLAIAAWRRYDGIEGPLQSLLLSVYMLIAVLPALLVMQEYLETNPSALADALIRRYGLSDATGSLLRGVFAHDRAHELGSALLAVAGALFFGLGFGRVLQLVYARAWRLDLRRRMADQVRFAVVLLALYGLILLLLVQVKELSGSWVELALAPGWVALLAVYFVYTPRFLTHGLLSARALLPGALVTALGIVGLMLATSWFMELWVDFYAKDYGGFGVVMALFFWIGLGSFVIIATASLGPALSERRELRDSRSA